VFIITQSTTCKKNKENQTRFLSFLSGAILVPRPSYLSLVELRAQLLEHVKPARSFFRSFTNNVSVIKHKIFNL